MHKTRIAALENQMKMLRETMVNATRQPLKIHVKCKKLHVKIRDGKRGVNTGQAADGGPATVTWTQEQNITQESPSLDGLVQEVHSTVEDIPANTSHLEIKTAVGSETSSRVEDCDADHHSTLGEREVCLVQKSSSDVADDDLARVATSSEQTGTPRMGYRSRVPAELARVEYHGLHQADASVEGYRGVIPQALSHEEDHLHTISPREDDSHVTSATFSRARNPDLVSSQGEKILSRLGIPDLISETTSRSENSGLARLTFPNFTSHGQIPETLPRMEITHKNQMTYSGVREYDQIRENHTRKRNCYSAGADEAEATKGTVRTFTALSSIPPGQMREHDRKFRQCTNVSDRQVVLEGMDDTADLISAAQDSPGLPHTQSTRCCSDCCFASCSCYAHAPISKVCSSEPKPCLPGSVVAPHKLQNLTMSTNMSDGNYYRTEAQSLDHHRTVATSSDHHRTLATSFDHHPLAISRPDSAALSPYLYFNSVERPFQYRNGTEICASALQPKISCLHRRAHPSSQTSQVSFSHDPHVFTSKNHDDIKHSYNSGQWTGSQQHKLTLENKDLELDEYHPSERCSPWMSFSEIASPETRCLHSAQNLGNRKLYNKQTLKLMAVNLPGSEMGYLSENKPCLCDTTENIYGPHGNYFQPDFSIKHHKSRERCEERIHGRMQRLRDEGTDSAEVDGGSHASLMLSGPRKTMDITAQNTNFTPTKYLADKTEWPASFKHTETFSSNFPCSKSERRSPNPHMYLNHRRIHDRDQYKNTKCAHSDKQRVQEDDIQHYQSLLRHRLERIPAIDDTNSSCPYQVCKDPQVLENHDYLISQTPHADQCSSIYQQHGSQSHSLLSTQYNPYIHKDVTGEHMSINYPCLSTTFTENCVERSPYCHQYVPQADQTVDQLSPSAVTEYLPKHGNYCNCFCFIDGCSQRRQIEGSQACLLNLK
ncbi:unnamed protein product [Candidula unifasciata]|uniref:Uncharacterized protein n=1 Tax=Candidula unifasciata TaxID=100452 RepID=A0A8S3YIG0_9EUPU|nr:unnamed protein product [Candidula unifasciata]